MDRKQELEQQLWDLVYELLPEAEAVALRQRISSEPETARAYAEVQLQAEILAHAAKYEGGPISLQVPAEEEVGECWSEPDESPVPAAKRTRATVSRIANWVLSLAALFLVGLLGYSFVGPRTPFRGDAVALTPQDLAEKQVRLTLVGPTQIQPQVANLFLVRSQTPDGRPQATEVQLGVWAEDGQLVEKAKTRTDAEGWGRIQTRAIPTTASVRLEVEPTHAPLTPPLQTKLLTAAEPCDTYLMLDRTSYQPAEAVRYRALTLTPWAAAPPADAEVEVRVLDPAGRELPEARCVEKAVSGIVSGQFPLPTSAPAGRYALVARSPAHQFPEARAKFAVHAAAAPVELAAGKRLQFGRAEYAPGDEVVATLQAKQADGQPLANAPVHAQAEVDGRQTLNLYSATDQAGKYQLQFQLPKDLNKGVGQLTVKLGEPPTDTISEVLPIDMRRTAVEFYPEAGHLVADVPNRVYFFAHDEERQGVEIAGRVVDHAGHHVAAVKTQAAGRGVFGLTPAADEAYRLELQQAVAAIPLPAANADDFVTLNTGAGVFEPGEPVEVEVHSTQCTKPLAIAASSRGVVVGQSLVSRDLFQNLRGDVGSCRVAVPVEERAAGVLRLTAYELGDGSPRRVAERLVFRRPAEELQIEVSPARDEVAANETRLAIVVRDEQQRPQAATLGISVVAYGTLPLAADRVAGLPTQAWLTSQLFGEQDFRTAPAVTGWAKLETGKQAAMEWQYARDSYEYSGADSQSFVALDLLLGTKRPRLNWESIEDQLATLDMAVAPTDAPAKTAPAAAGELAATGLTVLADNGRELHEVANRAVLAVQATRELDVRQLGRILLAVAIVVLIGAAAAGLLRIGSGARVWAPVLGVAVVCLLVGTLWMNSHVGSDGQIAWLPGAAADKPREVAMAPVAEPQGASSDKTFGPAASAVDLSDRVARNGADAERRLTREPQTEALQELRSANGIAESAAKRDVEQESLRKSLAESQPAPELPRATPAAPAAEMAPAREAEVLAEGGRAKAAAPARALPPRAAAAPAPAGSAGMPGAGPFGAPAADGVAMGGAPPGGPGAMGRFSRGVGGIGGGNMGPGGMGGGGAFGGRALPSEPAGAPAKTGPAAAPALKAAEPAPTAMARRSQDAAKEDRDEDANAKEKRSDAWGIKPQQHADQSGDRPAAVALPGKPGAASESLPSLRQGGTSRPSAAKPSGAKAENKNAAAKGGAVQLADSEGRRRKLSEERDKKLGDLASVPAEMKPLDKLNRVARVDLKQQELSKATSHPPTTLYWQPQLVTGADGSAVVQFSVPPHVKAYRVVIDAHGAGRLGATQVDFPTPAK